MSFWVLGMVLILVRYKGTCVVLLAVLSVDSKRRFPLSPF